MCKSVKKRVNKRLMFPVVQVPTKPLIQVKNKWCFIQIRMKLDIVAWLKDLLYKPCTENRSIKRNCENLNCLLCTHLIQ